MTVLFSLIAVLVSLVGLAYLSTRDPKRRRAFRLPPLSRALALPAWGLTFAPGVVLLIAGEAAAFVMWLGAASVLGWLFAARAPKADRAS